MLADDLALVEEVGRHEAGVGDLDADMPVGSRAECYERGEAA